MECSQKLKLPSDSLLSTYWCMDWLKENPNQTKFHSLSEISAQGKSKQCLVQLSSSIQTTTGLGQEKQFCCFRVSPALQILMECSFIWTGANRDSWNGCLGIPKLQNVCLRYPLGNTSVSSFQLSLLCPLPNSHPALPSFPA